MTEVPLSNGYTLLRVCVHCVCVCVCSCSCSLLTAVCVYLDGLNAEDQFRVWVTILDNTSHYYYYIFYYLSPRSGSSRWEWRPLRSSPSGRWAAGFPSRHTPSRCPCFHTHMCSTDSWGTAAALRTERERNTINIITDTHLHQSHHQTLRNQLWFQAFIECLMLCCIPHMSVKWGNVNVHEI